MDELLKRIQRVERLVVTWISFCRREFAYNSIEYGSQENRVNEDIQSIENDLSKDIPK